MPLPKELGAREREKLPHRGRVCRQSRGGACLLLRGSTTRAEKPDKPDPLISVEPWPDKYKRKRESSPSSRTILLGSHGHTGCLIPALLF